MCKLCGRARRLTDEDIVPLWARKLLIEAHGPFPRGQNPARIKMRICEECNSSLGARFERLAATDLPDLLLGKSTTLTPQRQRRLGTWITKTSLMGSLAGAKPSDWGYEMLRDALGWMIDHRIPPHQTSVRIGLFEHSHDTLLDGRDVATLLPIGSIPRTTYFSLTTMGVMYWEMVYGPPADILNFIAWADANPGPLQRVWPPQQQMDWPPTGVITAADITRMRIQFVAARNPQVQLRPPWRKTWRG